MTPPKTPHNSFRLKTTKWFKLSDNRNWMAPDEKGNTKLNTTYSPMIIAFAAITLTPLLFLLTLFSYFLQVFLTRDGWWTASVIIAYPSLESTTVFSHQILFSNEIIPGHIDCRKDNFRDSLMIQWRAKLYEFKRL